MFGLGQALLSQRGGESHAYWVSAKILDVLKAKALERPEQRNEPDEYAAVKKAIERSIGWAIEKDFDAMFRLWADDLFHFWLTSDSQVVGIEAFKKHAENWRDPEFRFFIGFWLLLTLIITLNCLGQPYDSFWQSLRYASFTVASITTTTGYATGNFELWPPLALCLLLLCMVVGGSVGSTGGSIKCMRIMVVLKHGYREIIRLIHPRAVVRLKLGDQVVPPEIFASIAGFIFLYLGLAAVSMFLVAAAGVDLVTTFSSVLACLGNVGPGLGMVGPVGNYSTIPEMGKWLLVWCMLLGRLEIYTVIIFLVPEFWRK